MRLNKSIEVKTRCLQNNTVLLVRVIYNTQETFLFSPRVLAASRSLFQCLSQYR